MKINYNNKMVSNFYIGNRQVIKIYKGDNLIFSKSGTTPNRPPYFEGITNIEIKKGVPFDLREGVRAIDPEQGEIDFTVTPPSINTNEVGVKNFTYSAQDNKGLGAKVVRQITILADEEVEEETGILSRANYKINKTKILNGVNDYIDTEMRPFSSRKDFSFAISFSDSNRTNPGAKLTLLHCMHEDAPWNGLVINREFSNNSTHIQGNFVDNQELYDGNKNIILIFVRKGDETYYTWSVNEGVYSERRKITRHTTINESIILGAMQGLTGIKDRFWNGTIDKFYYWDNYALSSEDIVQVKSEIGGKQPTEDTTQDIISLLEGVNPNNNAGWTVFDFKKPIKRVRVKLLNIKELLDFAKIGLFESGTGREEKEEWLEIDNRDYFLESSTNSTALGFYVQGLPIKNGQGKDKIIELLRNKQMELEVIF